ncbi:LamG domain-containing protein [bacterium]|nr:LamG domain-containing protein [bacterium]
MATGNSVTTRGCILFIDMWNDKSFRGAPATNIQEQLNADRNPTQSDAWSDYSSTVGAPGRWSLNHQDAIKVYNRLGTNISSKNNVGVQNWKQTYHGIWIYDEELGYPVQIMRDIGDGSWMYAGGGVNSAVNTPTKCGLGAGDKYVISWDQWTTNTSKSANCGLYGQNTTNTSNNFWDGLSNQAGSTAFNTKTYTWERCWGIFTISASRGLDATWSMYNYGHYGGRGITKVANFQIEVGDHPSKYVIPTGAKTYDATRTASESVVDITRKNDLTVSNLSYEIDNRREAYAFDNALNSKINGVQSSDALLAAGNAMSFDGWVQVSASQNNSFPYILQYGASCIFHVSALPSTNSYLAFNAYTAGGLKQLTFSSFFSGQMDTWIHFAGTWDGTNIQKMYKNGVEVASTTQTATTTTATGSGGLAIGGNNLNNDRNYNGKIGAMRAYNRVLSAQEIYKNYQATRGEYGV